ncbi:hypothetical protein [Fervidobacterium thailandense]|uniref:Uncharacterized protein n=1 Tax=Fervidobacterium thailandense TaxID=1008305 RepID=A0A1E3G1E8_9BACT|nr:hypothetical protein [Fervidobacterium thailandense]ODN30089.1 hypothetical protein A4H02_07235 [Fervidobacterium thailandense]
MAAKINRRTLILLIVMIVVWVVAIFVLLNMNRSASTNIQPQARADANSSQVSIAEGTPEGVLQQSNVGQTTNSNIATSTLNLPTEKEIFEASFVNFFSPYVIRLDHEQFDSALSSTVSSQNDKLIEDTTSPDFQYIGYMTQKSEGKELKKVFLLINGEYVAGFENELIGGRYKPIRVFHSFLIYLDTQDGRIKKVGYLGNQ